MNARILITIIISYTIALQSIATTTTTATTSKDTKECESSSTNSDNNNNEDDIPVEIIRNGKTEIVPSTNFIQISILNNKFTPTVTNITGGESINLKYVKSFLSKDEVHKLISICDKRSGWQTSPQNMGGDGNIKVNTKKRTSSSCPIIWPLLYLPKLKMYKESGRLTSSVEDEINFSWSITQRIASLLNIKEEYIEPLQLIRYHKGQFYRQHHDHGLYYGTSTSEQRPLTFLIFLSSMKNNGMGGQTKFNNLNIEIIPNIGDGVIWSNVDNDNKILLDAIHEAIPPTNDNSDDGDDDDGIIKYAMNVWITDKPVMDNIDSSIYRTY